MRRLFVLPGMDIDKAEISQNPRWKTQAGAKLDGCLCFLEALPIRKRKGTSYPWGNFNSVGL